ncbi:hypothetical protein [uncultured Photobacterium sp.]|uniref:hypothetical protein n=1 Tax=uncultured Photobacterium sp. TaxID=173973 RepID=UPI0026391E8B|nr:hypothetical protein [uncultured Photobacterium sp.]
MEFTGVAIVAIVFGFLAIQRYLGHRAEIKKLEGASGSGEVQELKQEVQALQERVSVLEKIVTDTGYQLKEEIRKL